METLEKKIRSLNREVLALKTSHPLKSWFKTFWHEFTIDIPIDDHQMTLYYEVTYVEGDQPILTDVAASVDEDMIGFAWPGIFKLESPVGNKQIFVVFSYSTQDGYRIYATFQSTRQIMGIRKINPPN